MKSTVRTRVSIAVAAIAGLTLATGCTTPPSEAGGSTDASGQMTAKMVGGGSSMSYTVPQVMESMGIDKKNGVDINYVGAGTSSSNMVAAVLSGDADFAVPAASTVLDAVAAGNKDLVVVACTSLVTSVMALRADVIKKIGVGTNASVKGRIEALKGLTIATSPEGSGNNTLLRFLLKQYGLNPDSDVKIIGVQDPSAIVGGIKQGQFDGGFYGSGVVEANIATGDAKMWISLPRGDAADKLGDRVGAVVITRRSTVEKNPKLVKAVFDSVAATEKTIKDDPTAAGESLKKNWFADMDQKTFDIAWDQTKGGYPVGGLVTKKAVNGTLGMLADDGKDYSAVDYGSLVYKNAQG